MSRTDFIYRSFFSMRLVHLERLAGVHYRVAQLGRPPRVIAPEEASGTQGQLASPAGRWAYYAELAAE